MKTEIKVKKKELSEKLAAAAAAADPKEGGIFGCALFDPDPERPSVFCCTDRSAARALLDAEATGGEGFTIPADMLRKLVSKLPEDEQVTLSAEGRGRAAVRFAGERHVCASFPASEFPRFDAGEERGSAETDAAAFSEALRTADRATAGEGGSAPVITGVNVRPDGDALVLAGMDGFRLARARVPASLSGDASFTADAKNFKGLLRMRHPEGERLRISVSDTAAKASAGGCDFYARLLSGPYVAYDSIFPEGEPSAEATADPVVLLEAAERVSLSAGRDGPVVLEASPDGIAVSAKSPEDGAESEAKVEALCEGSCRIGLNPSFLATALGHFSGTVRIRFYRPFDPVLFDSPESPVSDAVLPIRLQD